ncbi:hypothetical protein CPB83DRAFT_847971 [Crepidotus variabilis]|uniref:Uncharacterized protein n=1 Tax=Crepidotus variabilis TaxID=179855 RepID=A0A9P6JT19_9AGAR|nr:hypothetical protein CPB83DRAFT_847971 [Crepidotus variabilis]
MDAATLAAARKRMLASHRRSRSIPIITIDYFGSTDNLRTRTSESSSNSDSEPRVPPLPVRKPLTFVLSLPDREQRPRASSAGSERSTSRLYSPGLKTIGSVPKRRGSNPQLSEVPAKEKKAPMRRAKSSEFEGKSALQSDSETKPRKKLRRRLSDAPLEERLTTRFALTFSGSSEKKKLRTDPYSSSFYCPTPAPIRTIRKAATVGDLPKLAKKLSKSQTMITVT